MASSAMPRVESSVSKALGDAIIAAAMLVVQVLFGLLRRPRLWVPVLMLAGGVLVLGLVLCGVLVGLMVGGLGLWWYQHPRSFQRVVGDRARKRLVLARYRWRWRRTMVSCGLAKRYDR